MEPLPKEPNHNINNFINYSINDLKNLSSALRPLSRHSAETNNALINRLLLSTDGDSLDIIKDVLTHLLHIVDFKALSACLLSILTKVISFIKTIEEEELRREDKMFERSVYCQQLADIMYYIIDIIFLFKSKFKEPDMILRIIQTTFSLIDAQLLQYVRYNILTRIYAICFECGSTSPIIHNISISALFALTQIVFSSGKIQDSSTILQQFLEHLLANKKFSWIRPQDLKGFIWDLVVAGIRNFPTSQLQNLASNKDVVSLLNQMYKLSIKNVFSQKKSSKSKKGDHDRNTGTKKQSYTDFTRFYKTFVFFSVHLAIRADLYSLELVPYRQNIHLFKVLYELERDSKLYLFLEGVSILIIQGSHLFVEDERPALLLDIWSRVIEELCLSNIELQITSEAKDLFLEKICGDITKINDSDYVKIVRDMIIKLRKKLEGKIDKKVRTGQLLSQRSEISQKSQLQMSQTNTGSSFRKRWEKLVNNVIRIIRYLTSLNMKDAQNEQTVRKLIIELQYWYLICPSVRTRNLILYELLNTSLLIQSKLQAIKVSQCVQIGSNIIYGYYDSLDSLGLTVILKMMARVKICWEEGKGFEELDQVCTMSEKLYLQQSLVHSDKTFSKTIQSFVQCVNSVLSDSEQPLKEEKTKIGKKPLERNIKMTEYIFSKLEIILDQNAVYIQNEWNFLTGFWISLCCNRSQEIKQKTMNHIHSVVLIMLKKTQIQQELILSTYLQLSKLQSLETSRVIMMHLKQILPGINSEPAIVEIFRIARVIIETKGSEQLHNEVFQLEEMLIKEVLFRVKSSENIVFVIDSLSTLNDDQNEQYKTVNLLWAISDHLKALVQSKELKQTQKIWKKLFGKIYWMGLHSIHGETKQSCLHALTQILAESTSILGLESCLSVVKEIYLQLFYVLLSLNQKSPKILGTAQAQMAKVGVKNIAKLVKKCITVGMVSISDVLNEILEHICSHFPKIKEKSLDFLYQLCGLLDFYKGAIENGSSSVKIDREKIKEIIELIEQSHGAFDHGTVPWRKRYEPFFKDLKAHFIE